MCCSYRDYFVIYIKTITALYYNWTLLYYYINYVIMLLCVNRILLLLLKKCLACRPHIYIKLWVLKIPNIFEFFWVKRGVLWYKGLNCKIEVDKEATTNL